MGRKAAIVPKVLLKAWIPPEQRAQVDLHLVSSVEGRIPLGNISEFVSERLREFFDSSALDLTPYGFPPGFYVRGPKGVIEKLKERLEHVQS